MITIQKIYDFLDFLAPFSAQVEKDNSGLIVGNLADKVGRVYVCLDADTRSVNKAKELGCELIVSHHPAIFHPLYTLDSHSAVYALAKSKIALISAHTNLDVAACGVSFRLAQRLGLEGAVQPEGFEVSFVGTLPKELSPREFAVHCREKLGGAVAFNKGGRDIKTVGVIGGGGGDFTAALLDTGLDAVVTGEIELHEYIYATEQGKTLFAAGHYETEHVIVSPLKEMLENEFKDIKIFAEDFDPPTESV